MEEDKLQKMYEMVNENHRMLKSMRREAFIGGIIKFAWWIAVIVVLPYLIYTWYLAPYLEQTLALVESAQNQSAETKALIDQIRNINTSSGIGGVVEWLSNLGQ